MLVFLIKFDLIKKISALLVYFNKIFQNLILILVEAVAFITLTYLC